MPRYARRVSTGRVRTVTYHLYLTPAQFAFVLDALVYQQNRQETIDLREIESPKMRNIVRQALGLRRLALGDLINRMQNAKVSELEEYVAELEQEDNDKQARERL